MYLLDTDHLIILQRQSQPEFGRLQARMSRLPSAAFYLSIVSFHEQMMAANGLISKGHDQARIIRGYQLMEQCLIDFSHFQVLPFDSPAVQEFTRLR